MSKISDKEWEEIESKYKALDIPIRQIAKKYNVAESTIRRRAMKNGWIRLENAHLVDKKHSIKKDLSEYAAQSAHLTAQDEIVIHDEVSHRLKMEGIYEQMEEKTARANLYLINKIDLDEDDQAINKVATIAGTYQKLQKSNEPKTVINNNTQNNTLNVTLEEEKQELMNILNAYD